MPEAPAVLLLHRIRRLVDGSNARSLTDRVLLERFTQARDESAFEQLLRRHGPIVLGVCRRLLRSEHDIQDAFQATFLILVRRAASIRKRESVGSWLYGVAYRIATRIRTQTGRELQRERMARSRPPIDPVEEATRQELFDALDEELHALPQDLRAALLLCYLEGMTRENAARCLGWSLGTLKRRQKEARQRLRDRLVRRGFVPALAASALAPDAASALVPASLTAATLDGAMKFAASVLAVSSTSARAVALAEEVLKGTVMNKAKVALGLLLAAGVAAGSSGLVLRQVLLAEGTPGAQVVGDASKASSNASAPSGHREGQSYDPGPLAQKVWDILEMVQNRDIEPPQREGLLLSGMKSILTKTHTAAPGDLKGKVAAIKSPEQLSSLLREVWPKPGTDTKLSQDELEDAFVTGVLDRVPGKPWLMPPDSVRVSEQTQANRYVGIGLQLRINAKEKLPEIVIPTRHGPLRRAGAKAGDLIVEVDGKSTRDVNLRKVVEWLRGEEGTEVTVVVRTPGKTGTRTMHLTRSVVPFDSIVGYRRAGEGWSYRIGPSEPIGYVHLQSISSSTLHELRQIEPQLQAEGVRALVLDLRFSGGQTDNMHSAALVAGGLIDGGLLWRIRDLHGSAKEFQASHECLFRSWPVAVLIDGQTKDAAQAALAAALQDNGRAVLVGKPAGDGFVSELISLPRDQGAIAVRTARLERAAKNRSWPVDPDYKVGLDKPERDGIMTWISQKALPELPAGVSDQPPKDSQLARGVEILRSALKTEQSESHGAR